MKRRKIIVAEFAVTAYSDGSIDWERDGAQRRERGRVGRTWANGAAEAPGNGAEDPKTKPPFPQNGEGTAVCDLGINWRGQDDPNTAAITQTPVPEPDKTHLIPPIPVSVTCDWARIANGERVIRENPPEADDA